MLSLVKAMHSKRSILPGSCAGKQGSGGPQARQTHAVFSATPRSAAPVRHPARRSCSAVLCSAGSVRPPGLLTRLCATTFVASLRRSFGYGVRGCRRFPTRAVHRDRAQCEPTGSGSGTWSAGGGSDRIESKRRLCQRRHDARPPRTRPSSKGAAAKRRFVVARGTDGDPPAHPCRWKWATINNTC
jgi:hypothetical protein